MRLKLPGAKAKAKAKAKASAPTAPARASVDVSVVAQRFNFDWCMDPENGADADTYWWWAVSIRVDPNEVIAEGDGGDLWSIPFTTDGEDNVTFGEPQQVRQTFVPVAATDGVAASAVVNRRRQRVLAAQLDRPDKPAPTDTTAAASAGPEPERTNPMDDNVRQALARTHGLDPETATEDEVNAAVIAATPADDEPETPAAETETEQEETPTAPVPVAASEDGTVRVDSETWNQTQRDARAGAQAAERQAVADREARVSTAVVDGRIPPARRDHWLRQLEVDPGAAAVLDSLQKGVIPVRERGTDNTGSASIGGSLNRALAASGLPTRKES